MEIEKTTKSPAKMLVKPRNDISLSFQKKYKVPINYRLLATLNTESEKSPGQFQSGFLIASKP
jgi:hypothetical protein